MDTNRVEARFADGSTVAIDCIAIEDEYGDTPAQRAELDWLLYNKPLEYAQMVSILKRQESSLFMVNLISISNGVCSDVLNPAIEPMCHVRLLFG